MAMLFMCGVSSCSDNHEYVDLGLPSGTLWATCNVGATKPTEYGDLFAWGEVSSKKTFTSENYKFYKIKDDEKGEITKYNTESKFGTIDNKTELETQDDAASVNWGDFCRMPTLEEMEELVSCCNWEWTDDYEGSGVAGQIGKSKKNGNTIFLPAAGYGYDDGRVIEGRGGGYWSGSLASSLPNYAYGLNFSSGDIYGGSLGRYYGYSVRAVCPSKK